MGGNARQRGLTATGVLLSCVCVLLLSGGAALARPSGTLRTVRYRGFSVRVPQSWPVFSLARDPQTCVRFNRHAVYLGTPGSEERCPAHAVGRTEAILLSPLGDPSTTTAGGLHLDGNATSFSAPSAGVEVTATWSRAPRLVAQALGRKSLPRVSSPSTLAAGNKASAGAQSAQSAAIFTGLGFDTCTAPSRSQMSAWSSSPYRAVGIYVGGVNSACAQPNLTKNWVSHEIVSGWHPLPIYVGPQAPSNLCGCAGASTNPSKAKTQGGAAAGDAVRRAQRLGIPPGNPIYYDMEGYATGGSNSPAVLALLSGWTARLHAAGYISGVYSSASSGIRDLVAKYGRGYTEPDDIWIASWNGRKSASDPNVPHADWPHHQRLHQYAGNRVESYGGVTLTVDDDYVNGATATARNGYMILTSDGDVHRFGPTAFYGSDLGKLPPGVAPVVLAKDRKTGGYWILKSDGGVDNFHAPWAGSLKNKLKGAAAVGIVESPTGGYLVATSDGGVHPFHAAFHGSDQGHMSPGVHAVGIAVDRWTGGYWVLKSNGGVDNFHAPWDGSLKDKLGGVRAAGLAPSRGGGYFVLTSDGGVHKFGPATSFGSDAGKLPAGVTAVSLGTSPTSPGYRILRSDGGVDVKGTRWYGGVKGKLPVGVSVLSIAAAG